MTRIKIVCVGRVKEAFFRDGIAYYMKQIQKKCPVEILECPDEPTPENCPEAISKQIIKTEGERILKKIDERDYVAALCIEGRHCPTSRWEKELKNKLARADMAGASFVFVIGGSLGLSEAVIKRADEKLSFSALTFPHQMMRLILCGQIAGALR